MRMSGRYSTSRRTCAAISSARTLGGGATVSITSDKVATLRTMVAVQSAPLDAGSTRAAINPASERGMAQHGEYTACSLVLVFACMDRCCSDRCNRAYVSIVPIVTAFTELDSEINRCWACSKQKIVIVLQRCQIKTRRVKCDEHEAMTVCVSLARSLSLVRLRL